MGIRFFLHERDCVRLLVSVSLMVIILRLMCARVPHLVLPLFSVVNTDRGVKNVFETRKVYETFCKYENVFRN